MSLLRTFIAIEIPKNIHNAIEEQTAGLKAALGPSLVRWVPVDNIHLTLKFLGDISPTNVELLAQMLSQEASQQQAFEIQFEGLGVFPNQRRPRVLWIGIQAPAGLETLQHGIEAATTRLGYPAEVRPFSPHLTIGRVKQNVGGEGMQSIRTALQGARVGELGRAPVKNLTLFKSELKPTGAEYTQLHAAPLAD